MHYIPVNVLDNGCVWGTRIKTRNLIEAGVIALGVFLIMKIFLSALPVIVWTVLFLLFGLFPGLIALIGIGNESLSEAAATFLAYRRSKEFLPYNMAALFPKAEKPKEIKKRGRKEKRAEKAAQRKARKEEKRRRKEEAGEKE